MTDRAILQARETLRAAAPRLGMVLSPAPSGRQDRCLWHCPGCRCWAAGRDRACEAVVLMLAQAPNPCPARPAAQLSPAEIAANGVIMSGIRRAIR